VERAVRFGGGFQRHVRHRAQDLEAGAGIRASGTGAGAGAATGQTHTPRMHSGSRPTTRPPSATAAVWGSARPGKSSPCAAWAQPPCISRARPSTAASSSPIARRRMRSAALAPATLPSPGPTPPPPPNSPTKPVYCPTPLVQRVADAAGQAGARASTGANLRPHAKRLGPVGGLDDQIHVSCNRLASWDVQVAPCPWEEQASHMASHEASGPGPKPGQEQGALDPVAGNEASEASSPHALPAPVPAPVAPPVWDAAVAPPPPWSPRSPLRESPPAMSDLRAWLLRLDAPDTSEGGARGGRLALGLGGQEFLQD
jgi:hypothetical protein